MTNFRFVTLRQEWQILTDKYSICNLDIPVEIEDLYGMFGMLWFVYRSNIPVQIWDLYGMWDLRRFDSFYDKS